MKKETFEEIAAKFKLVCRKCGSENVVTNVEDGIDYGGMTGYCPGCVSVGCNDCKDNDVVTYD